YSMNNLSFESWMGLDFAQAYRYFDSGISYFIASQSIVGVLAFLLAYSFLLLMPSKEGQLFKNLAIFAFALSLLVSNGYFSIKTSALWWFVCGCMWHMLPTWSASDAQTALIKDDPTADGAQLPLPAGAAR
ncbi:polysaccharide biosynthesis protein GumE, partial [Xanthomonas perforans]|nr:polysaccharide biosynthesis protein GumE [Xanthomonas perforans]